jgi:hypothetical protein
LYLSQNIKTRSFSFSSEEEEFFNFLSEIWWWEHHEACSISEECTTYWDCGIQVPFGYTRKDVLLIGVGLTVFGVGLKFGLEAFGVDSLRAGNVVQIVMVAGLTIGWISSYIFRVSTKDMTYAKQLKDYENKVMEKRLEELPEAELETLLAQIEEEKIRIQEKRDKKISSWSYSCGAQLSLGGWSSSTQAGHSILLLPFCVLQEFSGKLSYLLLSEYLTMYSTLMLVALSHL